MFIVTSNLSAGIISPHTLGTETLTTVISNGTSIQYSPVDSPIDGAGRVTKVESGWVDGTHPATLATIDTAFVLIEGHPAISSDRRQLPD